MQDLLNDLPGEDQADVTLTVHPFKVTKVTVTYARTMQVRQYEPLSPSVTVEAEIYDGTKLGDAIRQAMSEAKAAVRETFAATVPAIMKQMDQEFVDEYFRLASPEQRAHLRESLVASSDVKFGSGL